MPGHAVMNKPVSKAEIANDLLIIWYTTKEAIILTILPAIIPGIKAIYIFVVFLEISPITKPYVASSNVMIGTIGIISGIPVKSEDSITVMMPHNAPKVGPQINAASITGICIGRKTEPAPIIWNSDGNIIPSATNNAARINLNVVGFLVMILFPFITDINSNDALNLQNKKRL